MTKQIILALFFLFFNFSQIYAQENKIIVYVSIEKGEINKKVFGNNFVGYDPATYEKSMKEYHGYSDYGAGIWDPQKKESVKEVIELGREAGISVARFPGGCGTHHYDWKNAIGKERKRFLYGLDEFLRTCEGIGAEPVITVSYFTGDEQDAADLVEYLNAPVGRGYRWADMRAQNGHSEPYGVKYFEIGNEDWHGDHRKIRRVFPQDYAQRYLKYYNKMKAVDSAIRIGVILYSDNWNREVLGIIKDNVDFGISHIYPQPGVGEDGLERMAPKNIFRLTLGISMLEDESTIEETLKLLKKKSGRDVPLAITEYNGGFIQEDPVPYRHCLGTALVNAEFLKILMKPEYNILMANYWQFVNEYWGMISNGFEDDPRGLYQDYYKRPNFYVFQLYHEHFGNVLIDVKADDGFYNSGFNRIPYLSINASKNPDGKKTYLMVINKNMDEAIISTIDLKDFIPAEEGNAWVLNGPAIDATNEKIHDNVKVVHKKFEIKGDSFEFTFEPHSLTAIELISIENKK